MTPGDQRHSSRSRGRAWFASKLLVLGLCTIAWSPLRKSAGGGPAPRSSTESSTGEGREFWSFQPVHKFLPPAVQRVAWPQTPVDRFILAKLEERGLSPAEPADKRTLIRRATFDLTGLPPTPREIEDFLADASPAAFAKVVDRLLDSPLYGQRWGRHWLDLVRYADARDLIQLPAESDFREAWRYRDWVVDSFNRDLPYDEFLTRQLAGDLLQPSDPAQIDKEALIATGMLALADFVPGDVDKEQMIADYVNDQIDVVGRAILGVTLACARCHDHKFDPIPTEDYYAMAGIFFSTRLIPSPIKGNTPLVKVPLLSHRKLQAMESQAARDKARLAELPKQISALLKRSQRSPNEVRTRLASLRSELESLKKKPTPEIPRAVVVQEGGPSGTKHEGFHDARVYLRGNPANLGKTVPRGFPKFLGGDHQPPIKQGSGRRELARWLTRPDHPLPARVMVNRIWQHHFGFGLVRTSANFGAMGERPSHPELLDYLAERFVSSHWSVKAMHRLIMLSSTYRQSTELKPISLASDPENRLLWRMNRRRLEAEAIRDSAFAVADRLDPSLGGPANLDVAMPRRSLYLMSARTGAKTADFGPLFDAPNCSAVIERRNESTVAPQALFLMNDRLMIDLAGALAARIKGELRQGTQRERIGRLYEITLGRRPTPAEIEIGSQFFADRPAADAWPRYCQLLMCTNEFIYVD